MKPKKLITLGSYHTDYFLIGDRIPDKGETVTGNYYFTEGGGKGSNHACACSILGGNVVLIQKLGRDEGGETACREFAEYGLSLDYVRMVEGEKTGLAPIMIDKDGNNAIMVFPVTIQKKTSTGQTGSLTTHLWRALYLRRIWI